MPQAHLVLLLLKKRGYAVKNAGVSADAGAQENAAAPAPAVKRVWLRAAAGRSACSAAMLAPNRIGESAAL